MDPFLRNRIDNNLMKPNDWYQNLTPISKDNLPNHNHHSTNTTTTNEPANVNSSTFNESNDEKLSKKDKIITDNNYKYDLLIAITPLILILLVFGGKLSILVMCFGCLFCYIFDLMGSIEGTMISLVVTMLSEIACIVWSSRVFLSESIWNFSLILLIWIVIFYTFIITCNFFYGIVREFAMILSILNLLIFVTLPTIGSAIISWFLCIEIPSLELGRCFVITYFIYMIYLIKPRIITKVIIKKNPANNDTMIDKYDKTVMISNPILLHTMYIQPIIMSFLISIAIHWNVLLTNRMFMNNILLAICEPSLLMMLCYQWYGDKTNQIINNKQFEYSIENHNWGFEIIRLIIAIISIFQAQNHPMFDDIKAFSSLTEPILGYSIISIFGLIVIAYYIRNFLALNKSKVDEEDFYYNELSKEQKQRKACIFFLEGLVTACFALAIAVFSWIMNLADQVVPITVIGTIAFTEYYSTTTSKSFLSNIFMLLLSGLSTWVTALNFSQNTIYYLSYELLWHVSISMSQFSLLFASLVTLSIILPSILTISTKKNKMTDMNNSHNNQDDVILGETSSYTSNTPNSSLIGSGNISKAMSNIGNSVFEFAFPLLVILFASLELLFREQDWGSLQIYPEMIYPSYYFTTTSMVIISTTFVLYSHKAIGITSTWIVLVVDLSKLLQLVNVSSLGIFSFIILVLSYTLPFIRQINQYIQVEKDMIDQGISTIDASSSLQGLKRIQIHLFEIILYIILATLATYWANQDMVIHNILVYLLVRDPTDLQQISLSFGIWLLYITCILQVFCFQWKFIRSFTFIMSGILFLIALEGFGHLKLITTTTDLSSLKFSLISEDGDIVVEHPVLFLILSITLSSLAWLQVIPLYNLLNCILYSLLFAFISTKAMINWSFPLSLSIDSFNHHITSFPFLYLYISKFFLILTVVWNPQINMKQQLNSKNQIPISILSSGINNNYHNQPINIITKISLIIFCSIPFFAMIYSIAYEVFVEAIQGIIWSAMIGCGTLCITVRYLELFQNAKGNIHYTSISQQFICFPTSILVIFWMVMAVVFNHNLDYVIYLPLSTLLLLSIKPGEIFPNTTSSVIISKLCAIFWIFVTLYAILIKGYAHNNHSIGDEFDHMGHNSNGMFGLDSDVSFWTCTTSFIPLSNFIQILLIIPALYKGFYPNKEDKEEMLFILSILSLLPILSAQINSLRLLGMLSMLWNGWRFYEIGRKTQYSNQLI